MQNKQFYFILFVSKRNIAWRTLNFCIRIIFGLRKYDHVSEFRTQLHWLPIRRRRDFHILSLLYNILFHPLSPPYLKQRFEFLHPATDPGVRTSRKLILKLPQHSSHTYSQSFTIKSICIWNSLPPSIRQSKSLSVFKSRVKAHFLTPWQFFSFSSLITWLPCVLCVPWTYSYPESTFYVIWYVKLLHGLTQFSIGWFPLL